MMIRKLAAVVAAATVALADASGGPVPGGNIEQDEHRRCAEYIWANGGRVVTPTGDREPVSLAELLTLPVQCPGLGSGELLYPRTRGGGWPARRTRGCRPASPSFRHGSRSRRRTGSPTCCSTG
jgi:hypothetical protein